MYVHGKSLQPALTPEVEAHLGQASRASHRYHTCPLQYTKLHVSFGFPIPHLSLELRSFKALSSFQFQGMSVLQHPGSFWRSCPFETWQQNQENCFFQQNLQTCQSMWLQSFENISLTSVNWTRLWATWLKLDLMTSRSPFQPDLFGNSPSNLWDNFNWKNILRTEPARYDIRLDSGPIPVLMQNGKGL